jgi:WhiB family redox-sensing transcriptional regulator
MVTPRQPERLSVEGGHVGLSHLFDLRRPDWHADALCKEYPHLTFVGIERGDTRMAAECMQVCGRCAVLIPCREYAIADPDLIGVWGGTTTAARRAIRANRKTQRKDTSDAET